MANVIFDTDILIDTSRGVAEAIAFVQHYEQQSIIGISIGLVTVWPSPTPLLPQQPSC